MVPGAIVPHGPMALTEPGLLALCFFLYAFGQHFYLFDRLHKTGSRRDRRLRLKYDISPTAKSLPGVQDIALNVQIENVDAKTHQHNELDVVLLINNVLHVLECKTANFTRSEAKAEEALYKLESLKKLGGLRTKAMLLSYRELLPTSRDRANGAKISLIERKDLKGMKTLLEKWTHG